MLHFRFESAEAGLDAAKLFELICVMPSLLVLDGFDEVGATQDRMRIVAAARELLTRLSERSASSQVLATTRPQGYADELSHVGVKFQKVFLAPLMRNEALEYAKKLIEAKISGADQQDKALRQIHEAAAEPATERLLTTPLQVTILTALVQQLGRAPRERWNLFSRYFAYTFDREIERGTYASALLAEHRSHIERIHARVALLLQVEAERDGGAAARMTKNRLEEVIGEVLAEDEVAKDHRKQLVQDIASAAENRLVFLVEPEPGKFGFEIRSLQEFMAAWALTSGRDSEVEARLYQVSKAPMFRNVALFIASRLFSEGSPLRDTLADRICSSLNEDTSDELSSASRAGSLLALETLEEGAALSQPKRARALMGKAAELLALPPGLEHIRLARAANEDTSQILRLAIDRGLGTSTPDASFCAASAWACLIDATNRREPWAIELGGRYWTPDAASRSLFEALALAHVPLGDWISRCLESVAHKVTPDIFLDVPSLRAESSTTGTWVSWLASVYGPQWRHRTRAGFIPLIDNQARSHDLARPNYGIPDADSWRGWIAAATFETTPTAENLIAALQALAKVADLAYWKRLQWRASWPLAACISAADEPADLIKQSELIRSGIMGDEKDWIRAERNWKDVLTLASIISAASDAMPWTLDSIKVGPPLFAVPFWAFTNRYGSRIKKIPTLDIIHQANDLFLKSRSPALRQRFAEICLIHWRELPVKACRAGLDPTQWAESAPNASSLVVPRPKSMQHEEWKALLDKLGQRASSPWFSNLEGIFDSLLALPTHPFLLNLAASNVGMYLDHYSFREGRDLEAIRKAAADVVNANTTASPSTRGDIAILKCFAGKHATELDSEIIEDVSAASKSDPDAWAKLLGALKIRALPRARVNSLLAQVYAILGPNHPEASRAIKEIRDALQKRTSDLDSRTTWNKLALPLPYPSQPLQAKLEGGIPSNPVRISRLEIQDVGGISKIALSLTPPSEDEGQWIVIIGPNGAGKTTILRSLALALRSVKHPAIWPRGAFSASWQRISQMDGKAISSSHIVVGLGDGAEHRTLIRPSTSIGITQLPEQDRPRLFPIFAYGCRRGSALGGSARQVNLNDDDGPEIATLFDEGADLIQAETWLVGLEGDTSKNAKSKMIYESITSALKSLMNLESIEVSSQRLWARENGGIKIPFSCLSDGYLTNAGWFLDLVARWITLAERDGLDISHDFLKKMRGLVLIDEIDLHLHPRWQIEIISRTRALMPQMSFVVTTHNPLTLVGAKASEVWILDKSAGNVVATSGIETPMLLTGGQIYQKYFGISDIFPAQFGRLLQRFGYLSGYALRTDLEEIELEETRRKLADAGIDPGWEVVPRSTVEVPANTGATRKNKRPASVGGKA